MKTKTLGRTGLDVSIVGLGTAFLGMRGIQAGNVPYEDLIRDIDEELGFATVVAALEAGCTLVDTAALYGGGQSEAIIGKVLRARPDLAANCTVTTKVGRSIDGYDYSFDAVVRGVEASLERLGLERLQIVYIHDAIGVPMDDVLGEDRALGALRHLQSQGLVGYIGTAADDPDTNAAYIETGEFDVAVVPRAWSLLNRYAERRIFPAAIKHDVGLVIATSIERGLLATGPQPGAVYYDRHYSAACQAHAGTIQSLCQEYSIPLLAAALQWVTRHPQVATTVPGARFPDEAIQNAEAAEFPIPEHFWAALAPLIQHWDDCSDFPSA